MRFKRWEERALYQWVRVADDLDAHRRASSPFYDTPHRLTWLKDIDKFHRRMLRVRNSEQSWRFQQPVEANAGLHWIGEEAHFLEQLSELNGVEAADIKLASILVLCLCVWWSADSAARSLRFLA